MTRASRWIKNSHHKNEIREFFFWYFNANESIPQSMYITHIRLISLGFDRKSSFKIILWICFVNSKKKQKFTHHKNCDTVESLKLKDEDNYVHAAILLVFAWLPVFLSRCQMCLLHVDIFLFTFFTNEKKMKWVVLSQSFRLCCCLAKISSWFSNLHSKWKWNRCS